MLIVSTGDEVLNDVIKSFTNMLEDEMDQGEELNRETGNQRLTSIIISGDCHVQFLKDGLLGRSLEESQNARILEEWIANRC